MAKPVRNSAKLSKIAKISRGKKKSKAAPKRKKGKPQAASKGAGKKRKKATQRVIAKTTKTSRSNPQQIPKVQTKSEVTKPADAPASTLKSSAPRPKFVFPTSFLEFTELECVADRKLEPSQIQAAKEIDAFLASSRRYLIIQGFAGTGKTYLLGLLNQYLIRMKRKRRLFAPTGRAARVLSKACGGSPASTIHGAIYGYESLTHREKGILFTFNFPQRRIADEDLDLIAIVDEGSLVSDMAPRRTKFFAFGYGVGTGKLLTDLIDFLRFNDPGSNTKLIVVGDPCQLPPVLDGQSYALSAEYMASEHELEVKTITLSHVVRQAENSGIVKVASKLRQLINERIGNYLTIDQDGEAVKDILNQADLVGMGTQKACESLNQFVVITYKNADALKINQSIRAALGRTELCPGDRLVISANNPLYGLHNGSFVNVKNITAMPSLVTSPLLKVPLIFHDIDVEYEDEKGENQIRTVKLLVNALTDSDETDIGDNLRNALFEYFRTRYRKLHAAGLATGTRLRDDPYFNAVRAKFGYAVTCHKAQGGEWDEAVVYYGQWDDIHSDLIRKWSYTAITRAKRVAHLMDCPEVHPLTKIRMNGIPLGGSPLEDRMKARLVARYGIRKSALPGSDDEYSSPDEFLCRILTDILREADITVTEPNPALQDCIRLKFTRRASHTYLDFWRKKGKTKSGRAKPHMFSHALDPNIAGSDKNLGFEVLESLAKILVPLKETSRYAGTEGNRWDEVPSTA
jgi:hypothetical protein